MKICVFSIPAIPLGKQDVKDSRLDEVYKLAKAGKKTYLQVDLTGEDKAMEADAILASKACRADLILRDLDFVETRLANAEDEKEKALLNKLKAALEKEQFISGIALAADEIKAISGYSLLSNKPVIIAVADELGNPDAFLLRVLKESGFISFFTSGEKESRAWLVRKGTTAWEAAGAVHSDIQKGFIRAEIISFTDFIACGGKIPAKQQGKMRLEAKEYLMQDGDLANFRFNK